nr:hypothetical protein CFP56_18939 [Quercus suber]
MDHYSKSLLELPDGSVKVPTPDLSAIRESILVTPQQKIANCLGGNPPRTSNLVEKDFVGETYRDGSHGEFIQGETIPVLSPIYRSHLGHS